MIRWLTGLLDHAADRILRDLVSSVCVAVTIALLIGIGVGFGAFAAYDFLRDIMAGATGNGAMGGPMGGVVAALIVGAACGFLALAIWGIWTIRQGQTRPVQPAAATPPPVDPLVSLLKSLVDSGTPQDQEVMAAAERLGRELSPWQLLALAAIGGFVLARKLDK